TQTDKTVYQGCAIIIEMAFEPKKLWQASSRHIMVLLFAALALWVLQTPLQRFISLGRYQHYGIAISVFGLGYLAQTIFSWRRLKAWGIAAYTSTGIFFSSVGLVFYLNPWLDYKIAVQTPEDE